MEQIIHSGAGSYRQIGEILRGAGVKKLLLVCARSFERTEIFRYVCSLPGIETVCFSGVAPNPRYEDICRAVELFNRAGCDAILAAGGGSALDTAKCVKLFCKMDPAVNFLRQEGFDTGVPLLALPTTAGTGSESTHFAVIYYEGQKQSVKHPSLLPDAAILEPSVLETLPLYQKKCTMLDALCQGIEAWWAVRSTEESRAYARAAIRGVVENRQAYIEGGSREAAEAILLAANYSGRAINITQTTAPHAMSYKLASLYRLPHGHAVAVCLPEVWDYMRVHPERWADPRGEDYLHRMFGDIAAALDCGSAEEAVAWLRALLAELEIACPAFGSREEELRQLTGSVNPDRLKNNPAALDTNALRGLYERIVKDGNGSLPK